MAQPLADHNGNGFTQKTNPDGSITVTGDGSYVDLAGQIAHRRLPQDDDGPAKTDKPAVKTKRASKK